MMTFLLRSWFRNFDQRFSAIFSDFQNRWKSLNENRCWKLDFFAWNTKHRDIGVWTVSHFFPTPRRFVWQNSAKRWHFFCSKVANYDIFRKSLKIAENRLKIAENRWDSFGAAESIEILGKVLHLAASQNNMMRRSFKLLTTHLDKPGSMMERMNSVWHAWPLFCIFLLPKWNLIQNRWKSLKIAENRWQYKMVL